jgi:hypothetical protein
MSNAKYIGWQGATIEAVRATCSNCGKHCDYDRGSKCIECKEFACEDCLYDETCNACIMGDETE